jgi:hypothetical protein
MRFARENYMKTTLSGVENPKLIDVVTRDPKTDTYKLVLAAC